MTELEATFYRGDYQSVIDQTVDAATPFYQTDHLALVIGALSFVGRLTDVDTLVQTPMWQALSAEQQTEARFYRAIGMCRHSCYRQAATLLFTNYRAARRGTARQLFFAYQGLGFYAYFKCRYGHAARLARLAADQALIIGFTYGRALSEDLRAHSLVQSGHLSEGLKALRLAQRLATRMGSGGLIRATTISQKLYEAAHGLLDDPVAQLRKLIDRGHRHNNYSDANLYLELAHQQLLHGQRRAAEATLAEASGKVFENRNRRHVALHNLRNASSAMQGGDRWRALEFIEAGLAEIDPEVDRALRLQLLCFKREIRKQLGQSCCADEDALIRLLRHQVQRSISWRAARRRGEVHTSPQIRHGEDRLGDLYDLASHRGKDSVEPIVASGYLGLLPKALGIPTGSCFIDLDAIPRTFLVIDCGEVRCYRHGYTTKIRQLLLLLSGGTRTKEEIVEAIWGYRYNPLKHDPLLYRLISRARMALADHGTWIRAHENAYGLAAGVSIRVSAVAPRPQLLVDTRASHPAPTPVNPPPEPARHLNIRQLQILRDIGQRTIIDPKEYRRSFAVSAATARRDLGELVKMGYLARQGASPGHAIH